MRTTRTKPKSPQVEVIKKYDHKKHQEDQVRIATATNKVRLLSKKVDYLKQDLELEEKYMTEMPPAHLEFCYEFVFGEPGIAGNAKKCYNKVFGPKGTSVQAKTFLRSNHIAAKIKAMSETKNDEIIGKRIRIEETLFGIMEECSKSSHKDRYGNKVMPSAMRSVAIGAAKELNSMLGLNAATETKLSSDGDSGIVFNVIVPEKRVQ